MQPNSRIYHLDALRCFCMVFGLMVHGATIGNTWPFEAIKEISGHFRMSTFFLVSGFFTAMVATRSKFGAYVRNRSRLVLVPLVAGLLLLNPITNWLIQLFHGGGIGFADYFFRGGWRLPVPGTGVWHLHLWFLFSLFAYAMLTPAMLAVGNSVFFTRWLGHYLNVSGRAALFGVAIAMGVAVVILRAVNDQLVSPLMPESFAYIAMATLSYMPYFGIGVLAFTQRRLYTALHSLFWPGLLLFGGIYAAHAFYADDLPRVLERAMLWVGRTGFIFLIVCALLAITERLVKKGSPKLTALTDGVYSFYMFHFLVIYLVANAVGQLTNNLGIIFMAILIIGYPVLFWVHRRLIVPSATLTLLFNGKRAKTAVAA